MWRFVDLAILAGAGGLSVWMGHGLLELWIFVLATGLANVIGYFEGLSRRRQ